MRDRRRCSLGSAAMRSWRQLAIVLLALAWVGCKTPGWDGPLDHDGAMVKGVHDGMYYLGLQQSAAKSHHYFINDSGQIVKTYDHAYNFVICLLDFRDPTVEPGAPRYLRNSGVDQREYTVRDSSCLPTFMGEDGTMLRLVPSQIQPAQVDMQLHYLQSEATRRSIENGMIEVAAIGFGASLATYSPGFRAAVMGLLPKNLPRLGLVASIVQLGNVLAMPHQVQPSTSFFGLIMSQDAIKTLQVAHSEEPPPPNRYVSSTVGVAGGYGAGAAMTQVGLAMSPVGGVIGQAVIPFMSMFILNHEDNAAKEVRDHFVELFQIQQQTGEVQASARVARVPAAAKVLAKSLVVSGWVDAKKLTEVCWPVAGESGPSQATCTPVFAAPTHHYGASP